MISKARSTVGYWEGRREKPGEFKEFLEKAKSYDMRGDREKAIEHLEKLTRQVPYREEPYVALADIYVSMEEYEKALEILGLAETNIGKNEIILLKKIRVNLTAKDYLKNETILKDVLKINESNIDALRILRDFYVWKKDWNEAYEIEKRIRKLHKDRGREADDSSAYSMKRCLRSLTRNSPRTQTR